MKRIILACGFAFSLVACGNSTQEPVELKDTTAINSTTSPVDSPRADSGITTNGAAVRPIDTASSQRRNQKQ